MSILQVGPRAPILTYMRHDYEPLLMSFDGRRYGFRMIAPQARYLKVGDEQKVQAMAEPFKRLLKGKLGRPIPAGAATQAPPAADWD